MKIQHFLFILFVSFNSNLHSQSPIIDSLNNTIANSKNAKTKMDCYNALFLEYEYSDTLSARKALVEAQKIGLTINYPIGLLTTYLYLGYFEEDKANSAKAMIFYEKSLAISKKHKLLNETAKIKTAIGNSYIQKGYYPQALTNYLETLKIQTAANNTGGMAKSYGNLGLVNFYLNNYNEALKYYDRAIELYKKLNDQEGLGIAYQNLGNLYASHQNYEKAIAYFNESLTISTRLNHIDGMANTYSSIGMLMALTKHYTEAQENYKKSLSLHEQYGNLMGIAVINCNMGEVFTELKQYGKANAYFQKSISLARSTGDRECLKNAFIALTKLDSVTGNYKGAFENHKLFIAYRDSLNNEEIRKKATQSQLEFAYEKKEAIAKAEHKIELEKQQAVANENSRKQKIVIVFATAGLLALLVFALFISRSLKKTKKQKSIIEAQKSEVETQKEIIEAKQKEVLDSIHYAKRIQTALMPNPTTIGKIIQKLNQVKK